MEIWVWKHWSSKELCAELQADGREVQRPWGRNNAGNIISVTEAQRIGRRKEDETREVTHTKALLETKAERMFSSANIHHSVYLPEKFHVT